MGRKWRHRSRPEAGVRGGDEGGDPLPQGLVEAARGRPPAAAMQQALRPVAGEALLEAVELSNREVQGRGALLIGDPAGEGAKTRPARGASFLLIVNASMGRPFHGTVRHDVFIEHEHT